MLDKSDYYHGAAIVQLMENEHCKSVRKRENLGYVVNENTFVFLKYTSKERSPWGFLFDQEDVDRCIGMTPQYQRVVLGFICGGDGVCALSWNEASELLGGAPGRIAAGRKHDHSYSVWGTKGDLKKKISKKRWPLLIFDHPVDFEKNGRNGMVV